MFLPKVSSDRKLINFMDYIDIDKKWWLKCQSIEPVTSTKKWKMVCENILPTIKKNSQRDQDIAPYLFNRITQIHT